MAKFNPENNAKRKKVKSKQTNPMVVYLLMGLLAVALILMLLFHNRAEEAINNVVDSATESILQSQTTPTPTVEPVVENPEPGLQDYEDTQTVEAGSEERTYNNSKVLSYSPFETITMTIGVETDYEGGLVLNPTLNYSEAANLDEPYGFLVRADSGSVQATGVAADLNDDQNFGEQFFCIAGRTYDKLTPAAYRDDGWFGIQWIEGESGGTKPTGAELTVHAIRLQDGFLIAAAKVNIEYDEVENTYYFSDIHSADVVQTGELSEEARDRIVMKAISFINEGNDAFTGDISEEEYLSSRRFIVVEKMKRVWFSRLFDTDGVPCPSGRFTLCDEIYAANIPYTGRGYMTVYFTRTVKADLLRVVPKEDYMEDYEVAFSPIAYDALCPFTVEEFNSFLLPEDAEYFGVN